MLCSSRYTSACVVMVIVESVVVHTEHSSILYIYIENLIYFE